MLLPALVRRAFTVRLALPQLQSVAGVTIALNAPSIDVDTSSATRIALQTTCSSSSASCAQCLAKAHCGLCGSSCELGSVDGSAIASSACASSSSTWQARLCDGSTAPIAECGSVETQDYRFLFAVPSEPTSLSAASVELTSAALDDLFAVLYSRYIASYVVVATPSATQRSSTTLCNEPVLPPETPLGSVLYNDTTSLDVLAAVMAARRVGSGAALVCCLH